MLVYPLNPLYHSCLWHLHETQLLQVSKQRTYSNSVRNRIVQTSQGFLQRSSQWCAWRMSVTLVNHLRGLVERYREYRYMTWTPQTEPQFSEPILQSRDWMLHVNTMVVTCDMYQRTLTSRFTALITCLQSTAAPSLLLCAPWTLMVLFSRRRSNRAFSSSLVIPS